MGWRDYFPTEEQKLRSTMKKTWYWLGIIVALVLIIIFIALGGLIITSVITGIEAINAK